MRAEISDHAVPFFPFRLDKAEGKGTYSVPSRIEARPLLLNEDAALALRLADGEHPFGALVERLATLRADAGGAALIRPPLERLLASLARHDLVWWTSAPLSAEAVEPPQSMFCELTSLCNLRCRHCVVEGGGKIPGELTTERWLSLFDEMAAFGVASVALSGGEPLLHPDIRPIAERARALGMHVQFATNGTRVTAEAAEWLMGLDAEVQVSLDGASPATHDAMRRGNNAFAQTIEGIRNLVAAGHRITVGAVVTRLNNHDIPAMVDLAESLGAAYFRLIPFVPKGRGEENARMALTPGEMKDVTRLLKGMRGNRPIGIVDMEFENFLGGCASCGPADAPSGTRQIGCSGARAYATITPDGQLLPCHYFHGVRADSVRDRPFAEVWQRSRFLAYFRQVTTDDLRGACRKCGWLSECGGSCRAVNFAKGDFLGGNRACWVAEELEECEEA